MKYHGGEIFCAHSIQNGSLTSGGSGIIARVIAMASCAGFWELYKMKNPTPNITLIPKKNWSCETSFLFFLW